MATLAAPFSKLTHLQQLEAESIHIFREVAAEFEKPVMLYSIGKDSSVMLRLAQKAFHPGPIPFPLLHIDTSYKFKEMISFRDEYTRRLGVELLVWRNEEALTDGANPITLGTRRCCGLLKTTALLDGLRAHGFDAAFGGARRDEEKSRAKERIFSFRDSAGQWDPEEPASRALESLQRPRSSRRKHPRLSPLQLDRARRLALHPSGKYSSRAPLLCPATQDAGSRGQPHPGRAIVRARFAREEQWVTCRLRSLGCSPCTGAIRSEADTIPKIIAELVAFRSSERANRVIDHDQDGSMELKKREGYF